MRKVYKVTFNEYTNSTRSTVALNENATANELKQFLYCHKNFRGDDGYLMFLTEDLSKPIKILQNYGQGIKSVEYVGFGCLDEEI